MNKNITKPLIIQFTPPEVTPALKKSQKSLFVPVNTPWVQFRDNILPLVAGKTYDSVLVHTRDDVDRDMKGVVGNMSIKLNALAGAGTRAGIPVLTYESPTKPFYLANPTQNDLKSAGVYAPADDVIMEKYNTYESDAAWQEHQGKVWDRMKDMMPLSRKADQYNRNHAAQLKDPKRGLEDKDLDKFWTFKSSQGLSPTIMGDDMVGMPSVEGREYEGFTMAINQPNGTVELKPLEVRSLRTVGASGIAIPMANADGNVNKHQIAADLTAYGTALHFRAADGKTVAKGELFSKKTREYSFTFEDGTDTHLKAVDVAQDNTITLQDAHGIFNVKPKAEIIDVLKGRGYNVPEIITSVKAEQNGKYMWQSPGTMTGSDEVLKTVSPSNPGFIKAREPKNGEDKYVVLVAEGALKGHIVAKYVDVKDKNGVCFGDKIAGDKGIIVTQVPGVAEAYVKNATTIYDKYEVAGTYIAMDADGRENRNVARGIHSAYNYINKVNPTTVLSWDPSQKGMDDALLAVAQGKITIEDMGIVSGKPEALFPIDQAHVMTPYKLDGTQTKTQSWVQEYAEDKKIRQEKVAAAQLETKTREIIKFAQGQNLVMDEEYAGKLARELKASEDEMKKNGMADGERAETLRYIMDQRLPEISRECERHYENRNWQAGEDIKAKQTGHVEDVLESFENRPVKQLSVQNTWVQTPENISNLQNVTVAKASEMADAMLGKTPVPKPEPKVVHTPDPDEAVAEVYDEKERASVSSKMAEVQAWDEEHPHMPALEVPEGYKAVYTYRQPVTADEAPKLPPYLKYRESPSGKWGTIDAMTDHELSDDEIKACQETIRSGGGNCVPHGDMRLVSQSFTLDPDQKKLELSEEDMKRVGPGNDGPTQ